MQHRVRSFLQRALRRVIPSSTGKKTPEHSHPADEATYALSDGKIKLTLPNGTTTIEERKTGELRRRTAPVTHVAENVGDTELRFLIIQLKKPQGQQPAKEP
jgi:quercetin dioxygenase-like cupin family protein